MHPPTTKACYSFLAACFIHFSYLFYASSGAILQKVPILLVVALISLPIILFRNTWILITLATVGLILVAANNGYIDGHLGYLIVFPVTSAFTQLLYLSIRWFVEDA